MSSTMTFGLFGSRVRRSLLAGVVALMPFGAALGASDPPKRLRCEYQTNPMAIQNSVPRLSWQVNDGRRGARQTAYQVQVAATLDRLLAGDADVWDSGRVVSGQSIHVSFGGFPLRSGRTYFWRVRTWDADGRPSRYSKPARWEMGLREAADWDARWIGVQPPERDTGADPPGWRHGKWIWHPTAKGNNQTIHVRKAFTLDGTMKVKAARIRCTADNKFVLYVNGQKIGSGDDWQRAYDYRVADKLRGGRNVIAVAPWNEGSAAGFRLAMRVDLEDGRRVWVRSDETWKAADREAKNWTAVDFDDAKWPKAAVIGDYGCKPWGGKPSAKRSPHRSMMMRHGFQLDGAGGVRRARAYVCGLGAYELRVNGERIGDDRLTPGWTQFGKRVQYQTYDVTRALHKGENAVGAILGNGWWHGRIGGERNQPGRDSLRLILQMEVTYGDGSCECIVTGTDWKACVSPIAQDSIYDGETYDARLAKPSWDRPGYDDSAWLDVDVLADQPVDNLVTQAKPTIKAIEDLRAVDVVESGPGVYVVDFGQNLTGWVRLSVKANRGDKIVLRHAEVMKDGKFYTDNLRSAKATDVYICKGDGVEVWEPRFTYHGFRYVEVTGLSVRPAPDTLVARMVCSSERQTGRFACSHDLINRIQHNILWGQRGNMYSVPTDCPQRDERLGWTGDAQMFCNTSCWNLDMARFYTKWLRDIADCQGPDGATRDVSPTHGRGPAKPAWGEACIVVPWQVYRHYGDKRVIEENYDCMVGWLDYMTKHAKGGLYERDGYGDWIAVVASPKKPISAAYYCYDCVLLSEMARAIGRHEDAERFIEQARKSRRAFNDKFLNTQTNQYPGGTQTANLLPLIFGLVPPHRIDAVVGNVVEDVVKRNYHLSTGFLGTGYINPVLTWAGYHDLAWRLAMQDSYPSWGYMVKRGATTIWELWNSDVAGPKMNSRNHFALGSVGEWFYETLAGITMTEPGFRRIRINPRPVGDLTWVKATVQTMYGPVTSDWEFRGDDLRMDVVIPANTAARILVPTFGSAAYTISEGGRTMVRDGQAAESVHGITFVGMEGTFAVFRSDAGTYRLVAHGVGAPPKSAYSPPPPPPAIDRLVDEFAGKDVDTAKWEVIDLGLESAAPSSIAAKVEKGELTFTGSTDVNYWAGRTLMSRGAFTVGAGGKLTVKIERRSLEPKGSGTRTSLWLWVDPTNHLMFSQDTESKTWSYNLNGKTGTGVELSKAADNGWHVMKMVHDGDSVQVFLDDEALADVPVSWSKDIRVAITGQARAKGDGLTARLDNLTAMLSE